jgi:tRNA-binding EMAP/Myf-like protein
MDKPQISIEEFAKIEVKVGTVLAAERVPETDKLIKCTVDFGEAARPAHDRLGHRRICTGA